MSRFRMDYNNNSKLLLKRYTLLYYIILHNMYYATVRTSFIFQTSSYNNIILRM